MAAMPSTEQIAEDAAYLEEKMGLIPAHIYFAADIASEVTVKHNKIKKLPLSTKRKVRDTLRRLDPEFNAKSHSEIHKTLLAKKGGMPAVVLGQKRRAKEMEGDAEVAPSKRRRREIRNANVAAKGRGKRVRSQEGADDDNDAQDDMDVEEGRKEKKGRVANGHRASGKSDGGEEEEDAVIQFGTFDFSGDKPVPNYLAKKKKLSDSAALRKALKDKERIAKLKSDESTADLAKDMLFEKALQKTKGEKVKDDPSRIEKKIVRKKKKKEKSRKDWKQRASDVEAKQKKRQMFREENIRRHRGKNKAKFSAEQKLKKKAMAKKPAGGKGRPGFEGKKKGGAKKK